ncbi:neurl4, partial [Symbiodinium sp. CCMP2456]
RRHPGGVGHGARVLDSGLRRLLSLREFQRRRADHHRLESLFIESQRPGRSSAIPSWSVYHRCEWEGGCARHGRLPLGRCGSLLSHRRPPGTRLPSHDGAGCEASGRCNGSPEDGALFTGLDPTLLGANVVLAKDRLAASSRDPAGNELRGVAFGDGPLPCTGPDGEAYFEVTVEEVRQGNDDGLVLGVASKKPASMDEILMGCDVKDSWSLGYNGCAFSPDQEDETQIRWTPASLKKGDRAGLLVRGDGTLVVLVNGAPVCRGPRQVPAPDVPLYPFIDLLGNTKAAVLTRPSAEVVRVAAATVQKAQKKSLLGGQGGGNPAFFDAW